MTWNTSNTSWDSPNTSVWDGFETIEARRARNDFLPVDMEAVMSIVELKVVASKKNPGQTVFVAVLEHEENGIKKRYDWLAKLSERAYLIAIKSLVCALNPDADESSFGKEAMDHITGSQQPCRGMRVHVRTEQIETKKGNLFTKVHWSPAN
jgi:hypothetical protein